MIPLIGVLIADITGWLALILVVAPIWLIFFALEQNAKGRQHCRAEQTQANWINKQAEQDSWIALTRQFPSMRER